MSVDVLSYLPNRQEGKLKKKSFRNYSVIMTEREDRIPLLPAFQLTATLNLC